MQIGCLVKLFGQFLTFFDTIFFYFVGNNFNMFRRIREEKLLLLHILFWFLNYILSIKIIQKKKMKLEFFVGC